ncbi:putative RNA polymerase-associated protein RTF1 [Quillaja saponaria]|uniref:RNA polymerase-associated protein RTF1 n=1 Tax=Quillaja saponaria TaxID=32244 RepID=A0AAD7Q1P5_QUISA|nr:putative RNA polymerase-associated protein RTF1 [Quillaja saponaria]
MADLENLLLEAAGRTSSTVKTRHSLSHSKRKHEGSYSDGQSDSGDEDSDDSGGRSKKSSRNQSQVPLKKRLDSTKRDDEHGGKEGDYVDGGTIPEGDSSDESYIGIDLYKNEDDRQRLAKMSELEREMILSERADKKGDKDFKEQLRSKRDNERSNQKRKETPPLASSSRVRSSTRYAERTAAKGDVLNELRAKRLKHQNTDSHCMVGNASRASSASKGVPVMRKSLNPVSSNSSSHSESVSRSDSEDKESSNDDGGLGDSDDDKNIIGSDMLTFEDIKEITIRRSKLVKWFMEPFFEELIVGCFVRIGIGRFKSGPVYRLCTVLSVDASDPQRKYKLENKTTHKYLNCVWGSESTAARFQMAVVSDSAPVEKEFSQWFREVERTCSRMPTKQDVLEKKVAIQRTNAYIYSAATVKQMLQEKNSTPSRPMNIAVEKDRFRSQLEVAKSKHDEKEVGRINKRLQELEALRKTRDSDAKAIRLAEMNRKNRAENFKNASELKRVNGTLKAGQEGYDPFSRRWTRSRNYYAPDHGDGGYEPGADGNGEGEGGSDKAEVGIEATSAALEAAADAGKLVDTAAPVDHETETNMLYTFDLPISLAALQKSGGPQGIRQGFLARKQRIEATVGLPSP